MPARFYATRSKAKGSVSLKESAVNDDMAAMTGKRQVPPTSTRCLCSREMKSLVFAHAHRRGMGKVPTCVQHCQSQCLEFGELDKLQDKMNQKQKTSFVVASVVPLARIAAACAAYYDARPDSVAFRLIQNVFFSTLVMFFLGTVMTAFVTGVGETQAISALTGELVGVNLFDRFVSLCIQFWPTIVVVAFPSDPLAGGIAGKLVKE